MEQAVKATVVKTEEPARMHEICQGTTQEITDYLDKYQPLMNDFKIESFNVVQTPHGTECYLLASWVPED